MINDHEGGKPIVSVEVAGGIIAQGPAIGAPDSAGRVTIDIGGATATGKPIPKTQKSKDR